MKKKDMDEMNEETIVQWQNSYSVGIKLVDEQHMKLINFTNRLFQNCLEGREQSTSVFPETIHEAVDYVGYHFGTEEKIMERVNYPAFSTHKQEHAEFVREVYSRAKEFNSGNKINTPLAFVYFLRDWVFHHIAVSDKKLGDYIAAMRNSGELPQVILKDKKNEAVSSINIRKDFGVPA